MKTTLNLKGALIITAENDVESFALAHWMTLWNEKKAALTVEVMQMTGHQGERVLKEVNPN